MKPAFKPAREERVFLHCRLLAGATMGHDIFPFGRPSSRQSFVRKSRIPCRRAHGWRRLPQQSLDEHGFDLATAGTSIARTPPVLDRCGKSLRPAPRCAPGNQPVGNGRNPDGRKTIATRATKFDPCQAQGALCRSFVQERFEHIAHLFWFRIGQSFRDGSSSPRPANHSNTPTRGSTSWHDLAFPRLR